ncbi:MAG: methyltransferase domain-containing protein [Candidatus Zixiibacteriota bacterium]|nr:MAG: methyltransferase domain-containing protein [candidate division Zixibacteria bacterium]
MMAADQTPQELLEKFKAHLLDLNRKINLVSRQDSSRVVENLIADSLATLKLIDYPHSVKVLDVGSGAGFPWIVHKIVRQDLEIISVDSNQRKIEFQRESARMLGLKQCVFHAARVETIAELGADFCIAKALGSVELICELTARHLKTSGRLVLPRSANEVVDAMAVEALGFVVESDTEYEAAGRRAKLWVLRKK